MGLVAIGGGRFVLVGRISLPIGLRICRRRGHRRVECGGGFGRHLSVAGNVGAESRFEYTVIGDPVNEAARLCELAKEADGRVLASAFALERAREEEARRWREDDAVTLRGRSRETRTAVPAG